MIKFFFLVNFEYEDEEIDSFDLGLFSSLKNANAKINMIKYKQGFKDYDIKNFKITKIGIKTKDLNFKKEDAILYSLTNEYFENNCYYWNIFGYYIAKEEADERLDFLVHHTRNGKKHPESFEVNKIKVDNFNDWSEGFRK